MKLYAIKWRDEEIKEGDWFKSLGCAISAITHFEGRVVEGVSSRWVTFEGQFGEPYLQFSFDTTHAGKTGMELKLWWAVNKPTTFENCASMNSDSIPVGVLFPGLIAGGAA